MLKFYGIWLFPENPELLINFFEKRFNLKGFTQNHWKGVGKEHTYIIGNERVSIFSPEDKEYKREFLKSKGLIIFEQSKEGNTELLIKGCELKFRSVIESKDRKVYLFGNSEKYLFGIIKS